MEETHVITAARGLRGRRAPRPREHGLQAGLVAGRPTYRLSAHASDLHATFVPGAAMLGLSLRHRGEELLGLPHDLETYARTGATAPVDALRSGDGLRRAAPGETFTAEWTLEVRNARSAPGTVTA